MTALEPPATHPHFRFSLALLTLAALFGAACASRTALLERQKATAAVMPDDPVVQAASAQVDAADAETGPSVVEQVELRARAQSRMLPPVPLAEGTSSRLEIAARLDLKSPLEVAASSRARHAGVAEAVAELEEVSLARRAERCVAAAEYHAYEERRASYGALAKRFETALGWNREWRKGGSLDELTATRFELEAKRILISREPVPAPTEWPGETWSGQFPLPELASSRPPLNRSLELVRETVRKQHPAGAAREATRKRYQALSEQALHASLPFLTFVEVGYEPERNNLGGRIGLGMPLGKERGESSRLRAEGLKAQRERDAAEAVQVRDVQSALETLAQFEKQSSQLSELVAAATEGEKMADAWMNARREGPAKVAGVLEQAFVAREEVIRAQEAAALAACTLLGSAGMPLEKWPRQ